MVKGHPGIIKLGHPLLHSLHDTILICCVTRFALSMSYSVLSIRLAFRNIIATPTRKILLWRARREAGVRKTRTNQFLCGMDMKEYKHNQKNPRFAHKGILHGLEKDLCTSTAHSANISL